jgi:DNA polymerase-4
MDAFFAAVEQHDNPELKGQPIAITNGTQGTCIITCSYEARAFGVRTGMRFYDAKRLCSGLRQVPARPQRYAPISRQIMQCLQNITPTIEIFSVDEAFLDITGCQRLHGTPEHMAHRVKKLILDVSGLTCSVGVSGDKTTAKYASGLQKPNGLVVIPPWLAAEQLKHVPVSELCGIGKGLSRFLERYGVLTCGDMAKLPIGILAQRFGNLGRRLWLMCQGLDFSPVEPRIAPPRSMGHGKVLPPNTTDSHFIFITLLALCDKLAIRLRRNHLQAQHFFVGLRHRQLGWLGEKAKLAAPTQDTRTIYRLALHILKTHWQGEPVWHCQVTALDPHPAGQQLCLFNKLDAKQARLHAAMDTINQRFGAHTLQPAALLQHTSTPNVIAPAWRPSGHRESVE